MEISRKMNDELSDGLNQQDLVIVSAFGRGNWLALETARKGWKTTLIDISEALEPFSAAEIEGPFGLLETDDISLSQIARVKDEGECVPVREGFNLWLKEGPLEFRGPMVSHQLTSKKISKDVTQYLLNSGLPDRSVEREAKNLEREPFTESWLAHLSHQIASPLMSENHKALAHGDHWPVFAPFSIRQVTSDGMKKGLQACRDAGVVVFSSEKIRELKFEGREAVSISLQNVPLIHSRAFVWMLSSFETRNCPQEVAETLFPLGPVEPKWYWARLQFELQTFDIEILKAQLPQHTVILEDPFLPWTHANLLVLRKHGQASDYSFDVWAKLPVHFLAQPQRLTQFAQEVAQRLERRIPKTKFVFKPAGEVAVASRLIRQPIFEPRDLRGLETKKSGNLFFCGPEQWDFNDWLGSYRAQNRLFPVIDKIKSQWDARLARLQAKAAAREAREKLSSSSVSAKENHP